MLIHTINTGPPAFANLPEDVLILTMPTNSWTYIAPSQHFKMTLPSDWEEYEDEPGVSAFFDATHGSGSLRITHIFKKERTHDHRARTKAFIDDIVAEQHGAIQKVLGVLTCAYHEQDLPGEDDETFTIHFWLGVYEHHRFACTFTALAEQPRSAESIRTLQEVEAIIASIDINLAKDE